MDENEPLRWNWRSDTFAEFCDANERSLLSLAETAAAAWNATQLREAWVTAKELVEEFRVDPFAKRQWQRNSSDDAQMAAWVAGQLVSLLSVYDPNFAVFFSANIKIVRAFARRAFVLQFKGGQLKADQIQQGADDLAAEFLRIRSDKADKPWIDPWSTRKELLHPLKRRKWLRARFYWLYDDMRLKQSGQPRPKTKKQQEKQKNDSSLDTKTPRTIQLSTDADPHGQKTCDSPQREHDIIDEIQTRLTLRQQAILRMQRAGDSETQIAAELRSTADRIRAELAEIGEIQSSDKQGQRIMVMHVLEHMDFAQIATILDLPVGKVREEYDRFALLLKAALTNGNGAQRNKGQENDNC